LNQLKETAVIILNCLAVVNRRTVVFAIVLAGLPPLGAACRRGAEEPPRASGRQLRIAAASDLRYALDEVMRQFTAAHPGVDVSATYGSSGNFFAQLRNRAPFDLYLSADVDYPRRLVGEGAALPDTLFTYAVGRLVLWVPASSSVPVESLGLRALELPEVRHVAIANPEHAPYGRAAEAAIRTSKLYDLVRAKLVFGENVSQALQFVQSGSADAGLVALSLALSPPLKAAGRYWEVPLDRYPRLEQGGAVLTWAADPDAARAMRRFLTEGAGRETLKQYGFFLPGA
jgi:molybdate transport system substrate-binding protein